MVSERTARPPSLILSSGLLQKEEARSLVKEKRVSSKHSIFDLSVELNHDDFYFPSVELLTAQVRPQKYAKTPVCWSPSTKDEFRLRLLGSSFI